ncbi:MAG: hypothetical protein JOZ19_07665 [Rubrobacter sp.]|nr:hypothetical protein [Rubrobacter sp.]
MLYLRDYVLRAKLWLEVSELSITCKKIQGFLLVMGVGLASIAIAVLAGCECLGGTSIYTAPPIADDRRLRHGLSQKEEGVGGQPRSHLPGRGRIVKHPEDATGSLLAAWLLKVTEPASRGILDADLTRFELATSAM